MYETLFDIRELSDLGFLINLFFFPIELFIVGFASLIVWKIKKSDRKMALIISGLTMLTLFLNFHFYYKKYKAIKYLENKNVLISEGTISQFKSGKSTYFVLDDYHFSISGFGNITPFFNDPYMIEELYSSRSHVRIAHISGKILVLEKMID